MTARTAEDEFLDRIHRFAVQVIVASGDAADHPDHPNAIVPLAARQLAHRAVLRVAYGVESYRDWELHDAVHRALKTTAPVCRYCRIREAMATAAADAQAAREEAERAERVSTLLEPIKPGERRLPA